MEEIVMAASGIEDWLNANPYFQIREITGDETATVILYDDLTPPSGIPTFMGSRITFAKYGA